MKVRNIEGIAAEVEWANDGTPTPWPAKDAPPCSELSYVDADARSRQRKGVIGGGLRLNLAPLIYIHCGMFGKQTATRECASKVRD